MTTKISFDKLLSQYNELLKNSEDQLKKEAGKTFAIHWVYHTLKLDDHSLSFEDVNSLLNENKAFEKHSLYRHLEVVYLYQALTVFILSEKKSKLSDLEKTAKELHKAMTPPDIQPSAPESDASHKSEQKKAGVYRNKGVDFDHPDYFFSFIPHKEIPAALKSLSTIVRQKTHVINKTVDVHLKLFEIYPFEFGHIRFCQLMTAFLFKNFDIPYFFIHSTSKLQYFTKLQKAIEEEQQEIFREFITEQAMQSLKFRIELLGGRKSIHPTDHKLAILREKILKKNSGEESKTPLRSFEHQQELLKNTFLPLINTLFEKFEPVNELFEIYELNCSAEAIGKDVDKERIIAETSNFFQQTKQRFFNINFHWSRLKNSGIDAFGFFIALQIELDEHYCYINRNNNYLRTYKLAYNEQLTPDQINDIANEMLEQLMEYIDKMM